MITVGAGVAYYLTELLTDLVPLYPWVYVGPSISVRDLVPSLLVASRNSLGEMRTPEDVPPPFFFAQAGGEQVRYLVFPLFLDEAGMTSEEMSMQGTECSQDALNSKGGLLCPEAIRE